MKKYQILKSVIIITVMTIILLSGRKAAAQTLSLAVMPSILEVMIKPGKSITQVYKLTNSGESVVVTPKLLELGPNGIIEDETAFTRDGWITIISNDIDFDQPFILGAGKEAEFLLKINPPAQTAEQDYYRALVFTTTPQPPTDTTMSSFVQNLATPLLITLTNTGVLVKNAQIIKFELPKILDSFDMLSANIEIKNSGKNYFRPVGKLLLKGPFAMASYDLMPSVILSGQTKQLTTEGLSMEGKDTKTLSLPGFYLGKYQLTLDFTLDESTAKVTAVKIFYAIPWKAGLLLLIVAIMLLWRKRRKKADGR